MTAAAAIHTWKLPDQSRKCLASSHGAIFFRIIAILFVKQSYCADGLFEPDKVVDAYRLKASLQSTVQTSKVASTLKVQVPLQVCHAFAPGTSPLALVTHPTCVHTMSWGICPSPLAKCFNAPTTCTFLEALSKATLSGPQLFAGPSAAFRKGGRSGSGRRGRHWCVWTSSCFAAGRLSHRCFWLTGCTERQAHSVQVMC